MKKTKANRRLGGKAHHLNGFGFAARLFPLKKTIDTRLTEFFFRKIPAQPKNQPLEENPDGFKPKNAD